MNIIIILGAICFLIGGVAMVLDVSFWAALAIMIALALGGFAVVYLLDKIKNKNLKTVLSIAALILALIICIGFLVQCFSGGSGSDDEEWDICYKCDGVGKVRNSYGYPVSCPRCNGVGFMP